MRAKKAFGQNFLQDAVVVSQIVAALDLSDSDSVIEIGPGQGVLTKELLDTGANIVAVEIDAEMIPLLNARFPRSDRFRLVNADILVTDLTEFTGSYAGRSKVVGNLPYYISTAILQKIASERDLFSHCVFMLQREVVERIMAASGSSDRGYLTVIMDSAFEIERLFDVSPDSFRPRPKVWSSVIALKPKPVNSDRDRHLLQLAGLAFAQKRKTILNNLKPHIENARCLLDAANIDERRRAETLTLDEWYRLLEAMR